MQDAANKINGGENAFKQTVLFCNLLFIYF